MQVESQTPKLDDASALAHIRYKIEAIVEDTVYSHEIFLDKLGERIAFEKMGVRLYDALLRKYYKTPDKQNLPELERLEQFYMEELKHIEMASDILSSLGGDPTMLTDSAYLSKTSSSGWIKVMNDPKTTFLHSLETILQVELVDNTCWEILIELADQLELKDAVAEFEIALEEENIHLQFVKKWVREMILEGAVSSTQNERGELC